MTEIRSDRNDFDPEPTSTCEFCGYEFPEQLGRYGCPNCLAEGQ